MKISYHAKDGKIFIRANMLIQKMLNIVTVTKMVKIDCKSKVGKNSILVKKNTRTIKPKDKVASQIIWRGLFEKKPFIFFNIYNSIIKLIINEMYWG